MRDPIDSAVTWGSPGKLLPTAPGMSPGVVAVDGRRTTTQCQVCLRTATSDGAFWAVKAINFTPDADESGHTTYRRCTACQQAGRHPNRKETPDA